LWVHKGHGSDNNSRSEDSTVSNTDDEEKDNVDGDYDPERLRAHEVMKMKDNMRGLMRIEKI